MVTGDPLFKSNGNMEQFIEIVKVLGTPTTSDLLEMNPKCDLEQFKIPYVPKKNWMKVKKIFLYRFSNVETLEMEWDSFWNRYFDIAQKSD